MKHDWKIINILINHIALHGYFISEILWHLEEKGKKINHFALHRYFISEILWHLEEKGKESCPMNNFTLINWDREKHLTQMIFSVNKLNWFILVSEYIFSHSDMPQPVKIGRSAQNPLGRTALHQSKDQILNFFVFNSLKRKYNFHSIRIMLKEESLRWSKLDT